MHFMSIKKNKLKLKNGKKALSYPFMTCLLSFSPWYPLPPASICATMKFLLLAKYQGHVTAHLSDTDCDPGRESLKHQLILHIVIRKVTHSIITEHLNLKALYKLYCIQDISSIFFFSAFMMVIYRFTHSSNTRGNVISSYSLNPGG